jgi:hypothetical protein
MRGCLKAAGRTNRFLLSRGTRRLLLPKFYADRRISNWFDRRSAYQTSAYLSEAFNKSLAGALSPSPGASI